MSNPSPRKENLVRQKTNWKHLPTKAVRIPEVFSDQMMELARDLDNGAIGSGLILDDVTSNKRLAALPITSIYKILLALSLPDLLKIQLELPLIIEQKKEQTCDRRLEQAILYLAGCCDGANSTDGRGFNKLDTEFGRWLADRISSKQPLLSAHAEAALKMSTKYSDQLERGGLTLPDWEAIAHQYPDKQILKLKDGNVPEQRIQIFKNAIAVYAPYDSTGKFQRTAKNIEGYRFNGDDKSWRYPLEQLEAVCTAFPASTYEYDPSIEGALLLLKQQHEEEAAAKEQAALSTSSEIIELIDYADLNSPLSNGWYLRDYQKQGVEWLLAHRRGGIYQGGILADQMGLGKSITSLVAARAMQRKFNCPVFVVCPVSLIENWQREAERVWGGIIPPQISREKAELQIEIFSASYQKIPTPLENQKYVLIADEAHLYQDEKSKRTEALMTLAHHENCLAAWMLTGTPIKNGRPINLYPLLSAIAHPLAADKWGYQRRYCDGHKKSYGKKTVWDATGASHLDELSQKTEDAILRRTKDQCLKELPAKTRLYKAVELEPAAEKTYRKEISRLVEDYRRRAKEGLVDGDAEALVTLNILRKTGSLFKVDAAVELAQELLEQNNSVVLFTEFLESAKELHVALGGEILTGETDVKDRIKAVDRFQSGESKIFVGTIKAGGVGLTLTAASNVILVDRAWTSGECEQAEDRCHRLGQANAVFATWVQLGEIDQAIDNLILSKQARIDLMLKGKRKTLKGIGSPAELAKELLAIL